MKVPNWMRRLMGRWIPWCYMCRFEYGSTENSYQRLTFYRTGWIVIDGGEGTAKDMLPITMVSQECVDAIEKEFERLGYPMERRNDKEKLSDY